MQVILIRHAQAEDTWPDPERRLTSKGRFMADRLGQWLAGQGITGWQLVNSPYLRAVETADAIARHTAPQSRETFDAMTPEDAPEPFIDEIHRRQTDTLFVGHNPNLEAVARQLGGYGGPRLAFQKCGTVAFQLDGGSGWEIAWTLPADLLPRWAQEAAK